MNIDVLLLKHDYCFIVAFYVHYFSNTLLSFCRCVVLFNNTPNMCMLFDIIH